MNNHRTQGLGLPVNPSTSFVDHSSVQSIEGFLNLSGKPSDVTTLSQLSYHELDEVPLQEVNALEQLEKNIQTLADLRTRIRFMNREIRYLMKV